MQVKLNKKQLDSLNEIQTSDLFSLITSSKQYEVIKYSPQPVKLDDNVAKDYGSIDDPEDISYELSDVSYDDFTDMLNHIKIIIFDNLVQTKYPEATDVFFIDSNADVIGKCQTKPHYFKDFKRDLYQLFSRVDEIKTLNMLKGFVDYYTDLTDLSLLSFDNVDNLIIRQNQIVGESLALFFNKVEAKKYASKITLKANEKIEIVETKVIFNAFKILSLMKEEEDV